MTKENLSKWKTIGIVSWATIGIILLFLGFLNLIGSIRPVFYLFVFTATIVYILRPLVGFFESRNVPRLLAVVLSYVILISGAALLFIFLVPIIIEQVNSLILNVPQYAKAVANLIEFFAEKLEKYRLPAFDKMIERVVTNLQLAGIEIAKRLPGITLNVFTVIFYFILAPLLAFYILKDLEEIKTVTLELIPSKFRKEALQIFKKVDIVAGGFLRGQILVAISVALLSMVALLILGVDYAILLGLIVGIFNIVPYLGPIIGGGLAVLVALLESPWIALWTIMAMVAVQLVDSLILSPRIVGASVNLHPVLIVFSLLIGGELFGFIGIFLAIPVAAAAKVLVYHFLTKDGLTKELEKKSEII